MSVPSRLGAEGHPLLGVRPEADRGVGLAPRQLHPDRALHRLRGDGRDGDVRPCPQGRPEGAAHEGRDHPDAVLRDAEHVRDLVPVVVRPLGLVVEGQPVAVPGRDGGVELDRVVVLARLDVARIDPHRRRREGPVGVADRGVGGPARLLVAAARLAGARGIEGGQARRRVVGDPHEVRRVGRLLEGLRHHHGEGWPLKWILASWNTCS